MGILSQFSSDGLDKQKETLGGGKQLFSSDVYDATIKVAYMSQSRSGAIAINFEFDINSTPYNETIYITNREKKNYYVTSKNTKAGLPGFNLVNNICRVTLNKELSQLADPETKTLSIYDFESRDNKPTEVPVLMELLGQKLKLAISNSKTNKNVKDGSGKYVPSNEIINVNKIEHVFNTNGCNVTEIDKNITEPEFMNLWLNKYKGIEIDSTVTPKINSGSNTASQPTATTNPDISNLFS